MSPHQPWSPLDWMFLGYSLMWAAVVFYVANLGRRQAALQREVSALHAAIDAGLEAEAEQVERTAQPR